MFSGYNKNELDQIRLGNWQEELALKEIKHGRLAMWAVMGQIGAGLMTHEPAFGNLDKIFS